jgi:hypothetical protein
MPMLIKDIMVILIADEYLTSGRLYLFSNEVIVLKIILET